MPRTARATRAARILARPDHPCAFERREGLPIGEAVEPRPGRASGDAPFPDALSSASALLSVAAFGGLRGCELIDPYSAEIQGHQLHVTVKLKPRVQVGDPDRRHGELRRVERLLSLYQLVRQA